MSFAFDNSFARELPGCYVKWQPERVPGPSLIFLNRGLAEELGLHLDHDTTALAEMFSGNRLPAGAEPIAQAYAGHQFGNFSPQLGDGRALLIGELVDRLGRRRDMAFKGSGPTPFARGGDGKAAVGPMLREVVIGEAMHALGVPTTRALAVVATGESVYREAPLPGANLTRVALSHLRVGSFEYHAARGDQAQMRRLADYAIARHDPALAGTDTRYPDFLRAVMERQAALIARWIGLGFIHGVMNTDNMSIAGETIDYGPCAFMEAYDPKAVFSSIDRGGRYAYGKQPDIAQWNLARLAEALLPLLAEDQDEAIALATDVINDFSVRYRHHWLTVMRTKLGLAAREEDDGADDLALAEDWLALLHQSRADFTLAWRHLADAAAGNPAPLRQRFTDLPALDAWLARWQARCAADAAAPATRAGAMRLANPWLIPRNHLVEEALTAASEANDFAPFERLLEALARPCEERAGFERYAAPAPASFTATYCTFCGT
ncbi:MAG: YdiU family protein [Rhodocyclales bacterium]|nr:YdiU family protein [Rhodocyclales bacterium]